MQRLTVPFSGFFDEDSKKDRIFRDFHIIISSYWLWIGGPARRPLNNTKLGRDAP
jgi:hypothetical protein